MSTKTGSVPPISSRAARKFLRQCMQMQPLTFTAVRDGHMLGVYLAQRRKELSYLHCAFNPSKMMIYSFLAHHCSKCGLRDPNSNTFCMWEWRTDWILKDKADSDGWFHASSVDSMCDSPTATPSLCRLISLVFDILSGGAA